MPRIALDFQPRRPALLTLVALLAGALLSIDVWLDDLALRAELEQTEARLASLRQRAERLAPRAAAGGAASALPAAQDKALRQALAALGVDWEALYRCIERAASADVALLAVRPSTTTRSVEIAGEARDIGAALAFVESLRSTPLSNVVLISHQIKQNDPQAPVVFEISAKWSSAS